MSPSFWQGLCYSPPRALTARGGPCKEVSRAGSAWALPESLLTVILSAVSHDGEILKV